MHLETKNNCPSHPFPLFSEAVHCIHLEKETSQFFLCPLPFCIQRGKIISFRTTLWASSKSYLGLWLLRILCRWTRTTMCYLGREAGRQQPQELLTSEPVQDWSLSTLQNIALQGKFQKASHPQCNFPWNFHRFSWKGSFTIKCYLYINPQTFLTHVS